MIDQGGRSNFPTRHPLNHSGRGGAVLGQADVILGLEMNDFYGTMHMLSDRIVRRTRSITKPGARTISICASDLVVNANDQQFQRFQAVDLAIAADGEETLPSLIEQVKRLVDADRKSGLRRAPQAA